jgi:cobalt ECF transporter T component CbiQ
VTAQAVPDLPVSRRGRTDFAQKTLRHVAFVVRESMGRDEPVGTGPLRQADPRVKLLAMLVLLLAVSIVHSPITLALSYLTLVGVALASRVPLGTFVGRVWLSVAVFTGVAVAPATLSVITPGTVVVPLSAGGDLGLTSQGLTAAALVIGRVICSVSIVLLVILTSSWTGVLAALGALGVPRMFVAVIAMAYRYLFVLTGSVIDMFEARAARTIGRISHDSQSRRFVGAAVGTLFGRAGHLADEVHLAMIARGYRGRHYPATRFTLTRVDALLAVGAVALAVGIVAGDHVIR